MEDNSGKIKVDWSIGKGKIQNGPDFSNTAGTIYLDSFGWDQIIVAKGNQEVPIKIDKPLDQAAIVLIRALPDDNKGVDIYPYLSYKFGSELPIKFEHSPLMLIGSAAKYVSEKGQNLTILYDPDKADDSNAGDGKAATTAQPPIKATISILVGVKKVDTSTDSGSDES